MTSCSTLSRMLATGSATHCDNGFSRLNPLPRRRAVRATSMALSGPADVGTSWVAGWYELL